MGAVWLSARTRWSSFLISGSSEKKQQLLQTKSNQYDGHKWSIMKVLESVLEFKLSGWKGKWVIGLDRWEELKVIIIQKKNLGFGSSWTKEEKERNILCKKKSGGSQGAWGILHFFPYYLHRRGEGERGTTYINQSRKVSRKINSYFLTILTMIFCLM